MSYVGRVEVVVVVEKVDERATPWPWSKPEPCRPARCLSGLTSTTIRFREVPTHSVRLKIHVKLSNYLRGFSLNSDGKGRCGAAYHHTRRAFALDREPPNILTSLYSSTDRTTENKKTRKQEMHAVPWNKIMQDIERQKGSSVTELEVELATTRESAPRESTTWEPSTSCELLEEWMSATLLEGVASGTVWVVRVIAVVEALP